MDPRTAAGSASRFPNLSWLRATSSILVRVLVAVLLFDSTAKAQEAGTERIPTEAVLEAKIRAIESSTEMDEALKTRLLERYRAAFAAVKSNHTHLANLARYQELAELGPKRLADLNVQLEKTVTVPCADALVALTVSELEAVLAKEQSRLTGLKNELEPKALEIAAQVGREDKIRQELGAAKDRLARIESDLAGEASVDESAQLFEARVSNLEARKLARTSQIRMLEQETVIFSVRLEILQAERELGQKKVAVLEEYVQLVQNRLNQKRKDEAARAQSEAEEATRRAHPALLEAAQVNEGLSNQLARVAKQIERASRRSMEVNERLKVLGEEFSRAKSRFERVGLSGVLGDIFRRERTKIPNVDEYRRETLEHRRQIARLRVAEIENEDMREQLADLDDEVQSLVAAAVPPIPRAEAGQFEAAARTLLAARVALVDQLQAAYDHQSKELGVLDYQQTQLTTLYRAYASFLDERLLWTPSATPISSTTIAELPRSLIWLLDYDNWRSVAEATMNGLREHLVLSFAAGLLVIVLLFLRPWSSRMLAALADPVGTKSDSFVLTLRALAITVAIAAPIPILLTYLGWTLVASTSFARAIGEGLVSTGAMLFLFFTAHGFCDKHGVAAVHLRWSDQAIGVLRRNMLWLTILSLPLFFVLRVTETYPEETYQNSLGRLSLIAGMLLIALFVARVFSTRRGVLAKALTERPEGWLFRMRYLCLGVAVGSPIAIASSSALGYHYAALQLDHRVLHSALTIVGGVVVYHLIVRWLVIARRRLAIARAQEKQAELRQRSEAGTDSESDVDLEIPEIDLATVRNQSQGVFRTAIVLGALMSLATVWFDVLPALGMLDRELWRVSIDGGEGTHRTITIATVLLALFIGVLTVVSSRNLPSLLEISATRRLPLDPGSRYAIATIGQYLLLTMGLFLVFRTIGVGWSHVQWLVAALSLGLGFGLQEIFANFVSGIIILLERPVRVGDTVTIGDISGTVSRIRMRATTIVDWDQKELVVPNKTFITGQLVNWSLSNPVTRLIVRVGIAYGSDTELALRLMLEQARANPRVLTDPEPVVYFTGFGDSALEFETRVFVKELTNRGRTRITHELHMAIDRVFRDHGVVIAFPQRDIHMKSDSRHLETLEPFVGDFRDEGRKPES